MRTLFRWIIVTLGVAALVRWFRHRGDSPTQAGAPTTPETLEDPAAELRRKLAESRTLDDEPEAVREPESSVDERREDVHAQGRAALAEMTPPDES